MSAMDKLLFGQLEKFLPAESKHYASPEGIKLLGNQLGGFVDFFRRGIIVGIQQNDAILKNQRVIMEAMECEDKYVRGPELKSDGSNTDSTTRAAA